MITENNITVIYTGADHREVTEGAGGTKKNVAHNAAAGLLQDDTGANQDHGQHPQQDDRVGL